MSVKDAWQVYKQWREHAGINLAPEPAGIDSCLNKWVDDGVVIHRSWTDAYLAAFAVTASHRLVTFDKGFGRFPELELLCLEG